MWKKKYTTSIHSAPSLAPWLAQAGHSPSPLCAPKGPPSPTPPAVKTVIIAIPKLRAQDCQQR